MNTSDVSLEDMSNEVLISVCEHVKCIARILLVDMSNVPLTDVCEHGRCIASR